MIQLMSSVLPPVSRLWLQFVATNGISKQLCLRKCPQLSSIARIIEPDLRGAEREDESSYSSWEALNRDHNAYASLFQYIEKSKSCPSDCIGNAVRATSMDHYPVNTLAPSDRHRNMPLYWSIIWPNDPNASETLIYKLKADLCCITEISLQPFEGHRKSSRNKSNLLHFPQLQPADDEFVWTYTSEEFHISQVEEFTTDGEPRLLSLVISPKVTACSSSSFQNQCFALVDICRLNCSSELRDMIFDKKFYICVRHVEVRGRPLSPAFGVQNIELSGDSAHVQQRDPLIHVAKLV